MTYVCLIELGQFNAAFPMSDSVGYSFKGLFILFRKVAKETTVSFCFCAVVVCNLEHCLHSSRCTDNFIALPILVFLIQFDSTNTWCFTKPGWNWPYGRFVRKFCPTHGLPAQSLLRLPGLDMIFSHCSTLQVFVYLSLLLPHSALC